ncbi:unnamed protein product [Mytilus edulis]|uniref:Fibrinogen C-terminal domain-containing protein n=1 Tax=Mytilus edulis TaxID=6550 RepID=A0A8S3V5D2_MYTED|nr:unnamed protein product [Mytilus edulis]
MRNMIRNSVQEELKDVLKTSLKEDSTKDLIRNITLQRMNDILEEQGRDELKRKLQYPKDCTTIHKHNPKTTSSVHTIYPIDEKAERVYCDMETDGGGWTVIQRRIDGWSQFQRPWIDYENGFGSVDEEYWFGDSMAIHNGMKFSTIDQDNDLDSGADCARPYGAWWHNHCGASCLNRRFLSKLCWNTLKTYSAKTSVMMLRKLK